MGYPLPKSVTSDWRTMCWVVALVCVMCITITVTAILACVFACTFTLALAFVTALMHARARVPRDGVGVSMPFPEGTTDLGGMPSEYSLTDED